MSPELLFKRAIQNKSFSDAIRILASVSALQTNENFSLFIKSPQCAFDLLKFVPAARKYAPVVNKASEEVRYARIIVEDMPDFRTDEILTKAINGDLAWAQKYKSLFKLTDSKIKSLIAVKDNRNKKSSQTETSL